MVVSRRGPPAGFAVSAAVEKSLRAGNPVVALEFAVITHGLPYPRNRELALQMEAEVRGEGAVPATVGVIGGKVHIGLAAAQIEALAEASTTRKIGVRDFASAAVERASGGTTVAATMFAASQAGIEVFATGGIGGVHRENSFDVSADLNALGNICMVVVCAGAKAILDLRATLEALESLNVPVIGFGTDEFPAFYARTSGLAVSARIDSVSEVVEYWEHHCALGIKTAVLVAKPIPEDSAMRRDEMEGMISEASKAAQTQGIIGKDLTPFLLGRLAQLSEDRSIAANVALLASNARLAAQIAVEIRHHAQLKGSAGMSTHFKVSVEVPATPEAVFKAWLSSKGHAAMTGSPAKVEPRVGGKFSAWDGYISGTTLVLKPYSRIVQSWRTGEFAEADPDSKIELVLEAIEGGTRLTLSHTEIPPGQAASYEAGWKEWYFEPMRAYFSAGI